MFLLKEGPVEISKNMQIAIVSSCHPRKCRIAAFSARVSNALNNILGPDATYFIALNNNRCYDYPSQVIFEIDQENLGDYFQAASLVNFSDVDIVSLQHEFELFGGPDGKYIKVFLKHLKKPVVTTFHSVPENPTSNQEKALTETSSFSRALVVMDSLAVTSLIKTYGISRSKIYLIPHDFSGPRLQKYMEIFANVMRQS